MNLITLFLSRGVWIARWSGPHAAKVVDAFGICDIPTPFTDEAPAGRVAEVIAARNPGVTIEVRP